MAAFALPVPLALPFTDATRARPDLRSVPGPHGVAEAVRALLLAIAEPIAVFASDGRLIEQNVAFARFRATRFASFDPETAIRRLLAAARAPRRPRAPAVERWRLRASGAVSLEGIWLDGWPGAAIAVRVALAGDDSCDRDASLTPREREVAGLIAEGARNDAIAVRLGMSPHTARRHTERVLRKLGGISRAGVARALAARGGAGAGS